MINLETDVTTGKKVFFDGIQLRTPLTFVDSETRDPEFQVQVKFAIQDININ